MLVRGNELLSISPYILFIVASQNMDCKGRDWTLLIFPMNLHVEHAINCLKASGSGVKKKYIYIYIYQILEPLNISYITQMDVQNIYI